MIKVYMAGKLFNDADVAQRLKEYKELQNVYSELGIQANIFTPILAPQNDKAKLPTSRDIFLGDEEELMKANVIFADLADEDAGVMMELGMVLRRDKEIKESHDELTRQLRELAVSEDIISKLEAPTKNVMIYPYLSDIRMATAGKYIGKYVPFGFNQFVVGGLEEYDFKVYTSFDEALSAYKKALEKQ